MKTYNLRNKLEKELEDYKQKELNKQLSKMAYEDKLSSYKDKEKSIRRKQYEEFVNKKKKREEKLKNFIELKKQSHQ